MQVLACIPLKGSIATKELADLINAPEHRLECVVRLMASAKFLAVPSDSTRLMAHTGLSASFVTQLSNLDAIMFLGSAIGPAALQMSEAGHGQLSGAAMSSPAGPLSFDTAIEQQPKLRRQWAAYCGCMREPTPLVVDLLNRLDWARLGRALIVDVSLNNNRVTGSVPRTTLTCKPPLCRWTRHARK
jgi:hypothetical protein